LKEKNLKKILNKRVSTIKLVDVFESEKNEVLCIKIYIKTLSWLHPPAHRTNRQGGYEVTGCYELNLKQHYLLLNRNYDISK
jgi:hypothetical protein